jgi:hypothetical protein
MTWLYKLLLWYIKTRESLEVIEAFPTLAGSFLVRVGNLGHYAHTRND